MEAGLWQVVGQAVDDERRQLMEELGVVGPGSRQGLGKEQE